MTTRDVRRRAARRLHEQGVAGDRRGPAAAGCRHCAGPGPAAGPTAGDSRNRPQSDRRTDRRAMAGPLPADPALAAGC